MKTKTFNWISYSLFTSPFCPTWMLSNPIFCIQYMSLTRMYVQQWKFITSGKSFYIVFVKKQSTECVILLIISLEFRYLFRYVVDWEWLHFTIPFKTQKNFTKNIFPNSSHWLIDELFILWFNAIKPMRFVCTCNIISNFWFQTKRLN